MILRIKIFRICIDLPMTQYQEVDIHLSDKQRRAIANAISAKSSVRLKFTYDQLQTGTNAKLLLTSKQIARMYKSISLGKGTMITLSNAQLNKMKSGGFLPMIIGSLVSALAPVLFNKLFPDKEGHGINLPGAGINLPGDGSWRWRYHA